MDRLLAHGHGRIESRDNVFTALRLAFAFVVVYAHALQMVLPWPVAGPWAQIVDFVGQHALNAFFVFSGYMILASLTHSRSVLAYAVNRAFRVFPLLVVVTGLTIYVLGPASSGMSLPGYLAQGEVWRFFIGMIAQTGANEPLPFDASGFDAAVRANAPLWTVRYELIGYAGLGGLALLGLLKRGWVLPVLLALAVAASLVLGAQDYTGTMEAGVRSGVRFALAFLLGAVLYQQRDRVSLSCLAAFAAWDTIFAQTLDILATGLLALRIGFWSAPENRVWRAMRGVGDYSYGVYIIHWPLGLLILHAARALDVQPSTTAMMIAMSLGSLALAIPLRHAVERPFQRLGRAVARRGLGPRDGAALSRPGGARLPPVQAR